jgi:hypothetical protein
LFGGQDPDLQCGQRFETACGQTCKLLGIESYQLTRRQSLHLLCAQTGNDVGFKAVEL